MTLMLPALTVISCLVGITGGYLLAYMEAGVLAPVYLDKALDAVTPLDVFGCITKGAVFGLLIGLIATYSGFSTPRTTEGVGESTTRSMVNSVLGVLVVDLILTKFFMLMS
jgi:phospholipid/cholesterol/gamma-HCH transport system permease protein